MPLLVALSGLPAGGCTLFTVVDIDTVIVDRTIREYEANFSKVHIGDEKVNVLAILPPQASLGRYGKRSVSYTDPHGKRVDIFFYRVQRVPDGASTDDEFVPYVFVDNYLTWIGWNALEGPKTKAEAVPLEGDQPVEYLFVDRTRQSVLSQPKNVSNRPERFVEP